MLKERPRRGKINLKTKITLVVLGVFLFFVLLEIALRLGGLIVLSIQEYRNRQTIKQKGVYRIMCIGGSTTADGGNNAYPGQLERILNGKNVGIKFSVINKGVESATSTFLLKRLPENLDKYKPDMLMVMIGENDKYGAVLNNQAFTPAIQSFFLHLRIYKLQCILWDRFEKKMWEASIKKTQGQSIQKPQVKDIAAPGKAQQAKGSLDPEARALFDESLIYKNKRNFGNAEENLMIARNKLEKAIELAPQNSLLRIQLADCYMVENKTQEAQALLMEVLEKEPQNLHALSILQWCYRAQGEAAKAEAALKRAVEIDSDARLANAYLADYYMHNDKKKEMFEYAKRLQELANKKDYIYGLIATLYSEQGDEQEAERFYSKGNEFRLWHPKKETHDNYQRIKSIAGERKIQLACIQHPMRNVEALKLLVGPAEGLIFVDNEKIFRDAVREKGYRYYFRDCFAGDFGHCTEAGNRLLAENIAQAILKEIFGN